jgi:hypothetical protein
MQAWKTHSRKDSRSLHAAARALHAASMQITAPIVVHDFARATIAVIKSAWREGGGLIVSDRAPNRKPLTSLIV